nr:uncharacterized protein LOC113716088 [Coffea arabica]
MKILEENPFARFLRKLKDYPSLDNLQVCIKKDASLDQRVYNSPTADQVAAIWIEGNDPSENVQRDIIVHAHSGAPYRVKHYYGCYDPLQYPILFPGGEIGWHQNIKKTNDVVKGTVRQDTDPNEINPNFGSLEDIFNQEQEELSDDTVGKVSCRQYYCYKLQVRQPKQSILLLARRLLQQYAVERCIKLETTRLDFYRRKQGEIRAELYQGIVDSVMAGETSGNQVGQRIVLPILFIGGPRDMRRRYLDAMALVERFGKPDLFITMTCNPEWQEIQENLFEGQTTQDRPDWVARVFRAKLQDLKDQLFKKEIFGKAAAQVHVIEFQKRGLPHAHMLIILKPDYKITSPDQFDKFVCAELPDKDRYPHLYELVVKHMIHGPCGALKKNNACMVNGKCKRRFDHQKVHVQKATLDDRWVAPYNPYLLTRYNCHINVEICSGIRAVKYLYKYIYKGHDRVAVYIAHPDGKAMVDEIQLFQDARWVSA